LLNFLYPDFPHVLCLPQHHLDQLELDTVHPVNYTLTASYCRHYLKKCGVCIYVQCDLSYSKIDLSNFSMDQHIEVSAILLSNYHDKIYILSIYRAPCGKFTVFLEKLESILNLLFRNNAKFSVGI
jgi:hypothetical protein